VLPVLAGDGKVEVAIVVKVAQADEARNGGKVRLDVREGAIAEIAPIISAA
jgi:hypothetical protein